MTNLTDDSTTAGRTTRGRASIGSSPEAATPAQAGSEATPQIPETNSGRADGDEGENGGRGRRWLVLPAGFDLDGPEPGDKYGRDLYRAAKAALSAEDRFRSAREKLKDAKAAFDTDRAEQDRQRAAEVAQDLKASGASLDQLEQLAQMLRSGRISLDQVLGGAQ